MARAPGRWRAVVVALVLLQVWSSMPVGAQASAPPASQHFLPAECVSSPQVVNAAPVGLDDPGRAMPIVIAGGTTACLDYTPTDTTQQVTFDLGTLTPPSRYTAQMLSQVKGGGAWVQTPVPSGSRVHLCFTQPAEDIAHLYLLIANGATAAEDAVEGSVRVRPVALPCGTWAVHARYTEYVGAQVSMSVTVMGEISLSRDPADDPSPQALTYILEFGAPGSSEGRSQQPLTRAAVPGGGAP
jgi:hypothetical protein